MIKLLKLQLRNVYHNKLFYICLILLLIPVIAMKFVGNLIPNMEPIKVFPEIIDFLKGEPALISIIFIILFTCLEFSEGTAKNIIARGYTKMQLLFSKYIVSLIGLFIMYIIASIIIFILFINNGIGFESNMGYMLINSIVGIIAFTIMYSTIAFLLEKNGASIIACLIVPNMIPLVLAFFDSKLKLNISDFWIDNVSNKFIDNPTLGNLSLSIIYYVIYIIIFIVIAKLVLNKKEIK